MRFPRLPDGQRAYSIVERGDGVYYRLHQGVAGARLPHDLVHLVVERETGEDGGFWGAVAAGAVFGSMEHLSGRRRPHAQDRSAAAIGQRGPQLMRAELMAGLVEYVADHRITAPEQVRTAAREALSTLPDSSVDEPAVIKAGQALREAQERWARLVVGEELLVDWPESRRRGIKRRR